MTEQVAVAVITVAELRLGVLVAGDGESAGRLDTLARAETLEPFVVDRQVAHAWARLRLALRDAGRRMPLNLDEYREDLGADLTHVRRTEWLHRDLPRDRFDQELPNSFGAMMTFGQVQRDNAEARVLAALRDTNDAQK